MISKYTYLLLFVIAFQLNAQQIKGTVSDIDGSLLGATVHVKGTNNITTSDFDGKYEIVAKKGDTLEFRYTGYIKVDMKVENDSLLNAYLELQPNQLRYISCWTKTLSPLPMNFRVPKELETIEKIIKQRIDINYPNDANNNSNRSYSFDGIVISNQEFMAMDTTLIKNYINLKAK